MSSNSNEKDRLYNRMKEAKQEVDAWQPWQKEAMGIAENGESNMKATGILKDQLEKCKNDKNDWPEWLIKSSGSNSALNDPTTGVANTISCDAKEPEPVKVSNEDINVFTVIYRGAGDRAWQGVFSTKARALAFIHTECANKGRFGQKYPNEFDIIEARLDYTLCDKTHVVRN